jgi:hypothetical protein
MLVFNATSIAVFALMVIISPEYCCYLLFQFLNQNLRLPKPSPLNRRRLTWIPHCFISLSLSRWCGGLHQGSKDSRQQIRSDGQKERSAAFDLLTIWRAGSAGRIVACGDRRDSTLMERNVNSIEMVELAADHGHDDLQRGRSTAMSQWRI